jgi:antitoxin ParD1/3/4
MNVALTARHKHLVAEKVKSGAYGSATEVVREGLRLLEAQDERQRRIEWLQREVEKGFEGPVTAWTAQDADGVRKMIARRVGRPTKSLALWAAPVLNGRLQNIN